jgi:hypothetical protein
MADRTYHFEVIVWVGNQEIRYPDLPVISDRGKNYAEDTGVMGWVRSRHPNAGRVNVRFLRETA